MSWLCTFQVPHGWIVVHRVLYIISQCGLAKQNDWGTFCFRMPVLRRVVFSLLPGAKQFPLQALNTPLCALLQLQDVVYYWMIDALHDVFVLTPTHQHPTQAMHMHGSSYNFILDPDLSYTHNERNIQLNITMHNSTNLFTLLLSNTHGKRRNKIKQRTYWKSKNTASEDVMWIKEASASTNLCGTECNQGSPTPCKFSSDGEQSPKRGLNMNEGETSRQMPNDSCI